MKKYNKFGYAGAMLLAGLVSFSACSSDDELADVNPNYNPETESVKTQFALSIPQVGKSGRMTDAMVQAPTQPFRGMANLWLLPTTSSASGDADLALNGEILSLENFSAFTSPETKVQVYQNVSVKKGTKNFLFYGFATNSGNSFTEGTLKTSLINTLTNVNQVNFSLQPCFDEGTDAWSTETTFLLVGLTNVATKLSALSTAAAAAEAEQNVYKDLITKFTGLKSGSAATVKATLLTLHEVLTELRSTYTSREGQIDDVLDAIKNDNEYNADTNPALLAINGDWKKSFPEDFPATHNIPDGAVSLKFAAEEFQLDENHTQGGMILDRNKLCYPAELAYFVNTDIACTSTAQESNNFYGLWNSTGSTWNNVVNSGTWNENTVGQTTQAIALKERVQYGVANLKTTFKCAHDNGDPTLGLATNQLADNNMGHKITVPAGGFPVSAVLVGGQPNQVEWNFTVAQKNPGYDYIVYDKTMNGTVAAKANAAEGANYTLVLDNTQADENQPVYIAVEFTNKSTSEIYGADGIIPVDSKFYLVAKLTPGTKSTNSTPNGQVFQQDYQTVANLTIGNLKSAYNCIPDLRASKLSLGMAVDLEWKTGLEFDQSFQ